MNDGNVHCARVYVFWVCVLGVCCEVLRAFAGLCYECAYWVCGVVMKGVRRRCVEGVLCTVVCTSMCRVTLVVSECGGLCCGGVWSRGLPYVVGVCIGCCAGLCVNLQAAM